MIVSNLGLVLIMLNSLANKFEAVYTVLIMVVAPLVYQLCIITAKKLIWKGCCGYIALG